ncbi:L,D-transpeptidase family protein [Sphingobium sp.]|uniref:L,D-transpeptidase family protein n=1 Tax=Sphingobium sp. TaxID=1912891 RepID=UPI0025D3CE15|nr:L,D-transpeptidase family protein [Sphingobium sp.]
MLFPRLFVLLCCLALGVPSARAELADLPLAPGAFRWADDATASGPLYLIVSIARQRVHVYRGDRLIGAASVSTGTKGHRTPTGSFPILQKRQWHRSNLYSNAPMPFMQRLTWDGIALHAGHNPGYPASHGCIRLPYAFARQLFALTRIGTLTEVTSDRLNAAILLDLLVVGDAGSSVVTFGMGGGMGSGDRRVGAGTRVPLLEIDPDIFGVWGRR